jgi:hypothetical protein
MTNTLKSAANTVVNKALAAVAVVLSTAIAWGLFELFHRGTVDNLAEAWVRSAGRVLGAMFSMDPTIAAFAFPLATFAAISLGAVALCRSNA